MNRASIVYLFLLLTIVSCIVSRGYAQGGEEDEDYGMGDPYGGYGDGYGGDPYGGGAPKVEIRDVKTSTDLKEFLEERGGKEAALVGFFDEESNAEDLEIFKEVAGTVNGIKVALATTKELLEENKYDGCAVILHRPVKTVSQKYERAKSRYPSKKLKHETLEKFIYEKSVPLVGEKSAYTGVIYDKQRLPVVTLFADNADLDKNEKQFNYYANRMRKVANDYKNELIFAIASKSDYSYELDDYGLSLPSRNDVGVGIREGTSFFKMSDPFGIENLNKFIKAYKAGEITPKIKEGPAGTEADIDEDDGTPSAVVTLNDANFDEVVTHSPNDVMIEFYAPWCGHCKALAPKYKQAASMLENVDTVTVAAFDATAFDIPSDYEVQGYPTLMFVKGNDKKNPINYDGDREAQAIVDFIQEHASTKFQL